MKTFLKFYDALGNSKAQKFRRFMLILFMITALLAYGFYCGALKVNFSKELTAKELVNE